MDIIIVFIHMIPFMDMVDIIILFIIITHIMGMDMDMVVTIILITDMDMDMVVTIILITGITGITTIIPMVEGTPTIRVA
jgi:hypothetical protein